MSKKTAAAPKKKPATKKSVSKKPAPKTVTKKPSAPAKKPAAKQASKKATPAKKPAPKKIPAKAKPAKITKKAPAKKTAPKRKPAPVVKPVTKKTGKKPAPKPIVKKMPAKVKPAKKVTKTVAKQPGKKTLAKVQAKTKAKTPVKTQTKLPAKARAEVTTKAQAKVPAKTASGKASPASKKETLKAEIAAKTKQSGREKTPSAKTPATSKVNKDSVRSGGTRARILFSFDEIRDYLQTRRNVKMNLFVPGEENEKSSASKKTALKAETPKQKSRNIAAVSVADILGFNPFKKDEAKFEEEQIPQKWRKYYRILIELRTNLQDGLALHSEEALKKSGKEDSGDLSGYGQHQADAGTDSFDRDFALGLVSGEQEALFEIAEAIERMKKGSYGVCEITGKPIPAERLTAVPFTRYTLEGQRQLERNRMGRRRGGIGNPVADLGDGVNFGGSGNGEETEEA